ncbi:MAG: GGDEF domain-containing protein [Massilia sp.]|nr:GGDEF domain-containing protein [Massilia sp.]
MSLISTAQPADQNRLAANQTLRLKRVGLGAVSYLFSFGLVAAYWWLGYLDWPVMANYFGAALLLNTFFYTVIRTGVNLRFADPSMNLAQITLATMPGLYVMYHTQQARGVFLLLCVSAAMYGLFKFRTRDFVIMTTVLAVGYGFVIVLLCLYKPNEIILQVEILQLFALVAALLQFGGLGGYIVKLRDQVKQKNQELAVRNGDLEHALARIEELAMRDELTGVYNRRYLMQTVRNEQQRSERTGEIFSICILDVDLFKQVNDTYGHLAGDAVLQEIARTANEALRQTDYFGRYGGEEFALLLTGTSVEGALITAERVRARIEALQFAFISPALMVTASIGIADSRSTQDTIQIFKRADEALYEAKQSGRNRCVIAAPGLQPQCSAPTVDTANVGAA